MLGHSAWSDLAASMIVKRTISHLQMAQAGGGTHLNFARRAPPDSLPAKALTASIPTGPLNPALPPRVGLQKSVARGMPGEPM